MSHNLVLLCYAPATRSCNTKKEKKQTLVKILLRCMSHKCCSCVMLLQRKFQHRLCSACIQARVSRFTTCSGKSGDMLLLRHLLPSTSPATPSIKLSSTQAHLLQHLPSSSAAHKHISCNTFHRAKQHPSTSPATPSIKLSSTQAHLLQHLPSS